MIIDLNRPEPTLSPKPEVDPALVEAIGHHHAGRPREAERLFRTICGSKSDRAVASYGLGVLYAAQGKAPEAIAAYRDAINLRPDFVDAYINLGTTVLALGRAEQAASIYRVALAINPENGMAHGNLGKALQDLGRIDEAMASYRAGIACQPDNAIIHVNLGAVLVERKAWADALAVTRRAIELAPANAMAHANLGTALLRTGRYEEALVACRRALALQPEGVAFYASLGGAMLELGASREAATLCRRAIDLDPTRPTAHFNLSHALKGLNRLKEAEQSARDAIALDPDSAEFHFHLSHILLLQGDLKAGWDEYDWRLRMPDFAWIGDLFGAAAKPQWLGEDIEDKTILVFTEQGLGDIIQFARYLPILVNRAGRVIVATHPPARRLLETIEGIRLVPIREAARQQFDVMCPLLSLPRAFATGIDTIPTGGPYFHVDPAEQARWDRRIGGKALRVGIVWAGNPITTRDRFRSPGHGSVAPLFSIPNVDFVILQVGPGRDGHDAASLPAHVLDLGKEITDLADTAAIMAGLDLMISSCTGPLHLAGSLGVPTWAMIPFAPHFPWLLERDDTSWYPSMRLYRQEHPGKDWAGVVGRIAADLRALAENHSGLPRPAPPHGSADEPKHNQIRLPVETTGFNELAICRSGPMLFNRNDIYIGASMRKYGEFSPGETALFGVIVQPGMTVLDVGANIGVHAVDLSRFVGATGSIHAFEPQRLMFQILCANVALNSRANVFTHHVAVGAKPGQLLVPHLDPAHAHNYGGVPLSGVEHGEAVPLITIDSLDLRACHVIKLDVEGMEIEALKGAVATIARCRPLLYVENDRADRSAALIMLIQSSGYRLYWHLPRLYSAGNYRGDPENIFGDTVSVNMLCVPAEMSQSSLSVMREVTGPDDVWYKS